MGNCLDIPPPPTKRHSAYFTRPRYVVAMRTRPYDSDSLVQIPRAYSAYQPYADFGRFRPIMDLDPVSGYPYTHRLNPPTATPAYYSDPIYMTDSRYDYYESTVLRDATYKKSHRQRDKRSRHKETAVERDHEAQISNNKGVIFSEDFTSPEITNATSTITTISVASQTREEEYSSGEDISARPDVIYSSTAVANNTEIAWNNIQPLTSEPIHEELTVDNTTEVVENIQNVRANVDVPLEKNYSDEFAYTDETVESLFQPIQDEPGTQKAVNSSSDPTLAVILPDSQSKLDNCRRSPYTPPDVVLCYHSADVKVMRRIKNKLQTARLNTAVSYPTDGTVEDDFIDWLMFPQAVVDAKVMVVLLSHNSVKDKHVMDEICLAQVTETLIYPVVLEKSLDILNMMDAGLKLQLKCYKWIELGDNQDFAVALMVRNVKEDLDCMKSSDGNPKDRGEDSERVYRRQKTFRQRQVQKMVKLEGHVTAVQYWHKCYGSDTDSVSWERFYDVLCKEYGKQLKDSAYESCGPHFVNSLKKEMGVRNDEIVHKAQFVEFGNKLDTDQDIWERIQGVARETEAIRHVLDMESTLRIVGIENIGKFGSPNALDALRELLSDTNPNIRAVAALSLSRSMSEGDQVMLTALMTTLDDQDELVRQTGCLAVGHLRAQEAIGKLSHICQNDVIPQVREAATVALNRIEGSNLKQT